VSAVTSVASGTGAVVRYQITIRSTPVAATDFQESRIVLAESAFAVRRSGLTGLSLPTLKNVVCTLLVRLFLPSSSTAAHIVFFSLLNCLLTINNE